MINTYLKQNNQIYKSSDVVIESSIWIDIINISPQEEQLIESILKIDIPTREEIAQIEISNRLYRENKSLYITLLLPHENTEIVTNHLITFIIHKNKIISIRYNEDLKPFNHFLHKINSSKEKYSEAKIIFLSLLHIMVGKLADILEGIRGNIDLINSEIFPKSSKNKDKVNYLAILEKISHQENCISKAQESLLSFARAINFCKKSVEFNQSKANILKLEIMLTDIQALNEYTHALSTETTFLLDASMGMINIEQNNIVKLVSVVSLVFMPPTLIASIYGMNFEFMPELKHTLGYPLIIILMIISAWLPYKICRKKKWL